MPSSPSRIESSVVHTDSYELGHGEFAHSRARTVAPSRTTAPPDSVARKSRTGAARLRAQAVRSRNSAGRGAGSGAMGGNGSRHTLDPIGGRGAQAVTDGRRSPPP